MKRILYKASFKKGEKYHTDDLYEISSYDRYFDKLPETSETDIDTSNNELCLRSFTIVVYEEIPKNSKVLLKNKDKKGGKE